MKRFFLSLLTDKSFWAALVALISCVLVALRVPTGSVEQIASLIGGLGTLISYIISNGITQAAQIRADAQIRIAEAAAKAERQGK